MSKQDFFPPRLKTAKNAEQLSAIVVDAAYHLHKDLGPGRLVVELKSVEKFAPVHGKQL